MRIELKSQELKKAFKNIKFVASKIMMRQSSFVCNNKIG